MDIRGNKGYLTIPEQIDSELTSPIDISALNVCKALREAASEVGRLQEMQAADDDELTHAERASVTPQLTRALAQKVIYSQIATEQITAGQIDLDQVIGYL